MIDIHCHILPGLDDGPSAIEESIEMARQASSDGIHTVIATPHTLNDVYTNPLNQIAVHVEDFRKRLAEMNIPLEICLGSDAHLSRQMLERVVSGDATTLNNQGRYLLIEFPHHFIPEWYKEELFRLKTSGITPIITHPERNVILMENREMLYDLVSSGCLIQITAMSVTGEFGEFPLELATFILKHRLGHFIASDAHSSLGRCPILSPAVESAAKIMGNLEEAQQLVKENPEAALSGKPLTIPIPIKMERKKWSFFKFLKSR